MRWKVAKNIATSTATYLLRANTHSVYLVSPLHSILSNKQLNSAGDEAWQIIPQVSYGANEQDVAGKWLKRGLGVTWWKSSLPVLCCRWKLRPSGRLQVTQDGGSNLHKTLLQCSPPAPEHKSLLLPSLPYVHRQTDRQAGTLAQSQLHKLQRGHKAALEQETAAGTEKWTLTEGSAMLWLSWPRAAAKGLFCHWRVTVKFWVPFLCPSSPQESVTEQLNNTWWSRVQPHVLPFPSRQSSLFKRNYGSAMTGKAHGVWAIPSQWWFCSSFQQVGIYVPPFLWAKSSKFL